MFDKQTVEIYKSIKASDRLKLRVQELAKDIPENQTEKTEKRNFVFMLNKNYTKLVTTAVAAVFCVAIGFAAARFRPESMSVTVAGQNPDSTYVQIETSSKGFALARIAEPDIASLSADGENLSIEFSVDSENGAEVSVTKGFLILPESLEEKFGTFTVGKASMLLWNIEGIGPCESAKLIIRGKRHEKVYILNNIDGIWTLRLEQ